MEVESYRLWWDYTEAYGDMILASDTEYAPWYCVNSDEKKRARLNCIAHLLSVIPHKEVTFDPPKLPERKPNKKNVSSPLFKHIVPERY